MTKPALVVIDIQKEYTTEGRPFYLKGIEPSLENCRQILALARKNGWDVAHVQHFSIKEGAAIFDPKSEYSGFVEGFEPQQGEQLITKNLYSCYSGEGFAAFVNAHRDNDIYLIGYNSIMCCLSTVIEGFHKGQKFTFVEDASLAKATVEFGEQDMHAHSVSQIKAAGYATVTTTQELQQKYENRLSPR